MTGRIAIIRGHPDPSSHHLLHTMADAYVLSLPLIMTAAGVFHPIRLKRSPPGGVFAPYRCRRQLAKPLSNWKMFGQPCPKLQMTNCQPTKRR